MRSRRSHWKLHRVAAAVLIAALAATTAVAGGRTKTPPQCGVTVNPVTNGYGYTLVGYGFPGGIGVTVFVADQFETWMYRGTAAFNGSFSIPATATFTYTGTKGMYVNRTGDRKMATLCQAQFTVQ